MRQPSHFVVRVYVRYEVLLQPRLAAHEDSIAPSRNPVLVGGVIQTASIVILVSRIEVQIALLKHAEDLVFLARLQQLILFLESGVI